MLVLVRFAQTSPSTYWFQDMEKFSKNRDWLDCREIFPTLKRPEDITSLFKVALVRHCLQLTSGDSELATRSPPSLQANDLIGCRKLSCDLCFKVIIYTNNPDNLKLSPPLLTTVANTYWRMRPINTGFHRYLDSGNDVTFIIFPSTWFVFFKPSEAFIIRGEE